MIARMALLAIVVPALTACYDSGFGTPEPEPNSEAVTETIAHLRDRFLGSPLRIDSNIIVEGTVVSSDRAGNFYRTLCIENNGAALEIMAGIDHLHNLYPVGCSVVVHLKGLTLAQRLGVLQVGNQPLPGSGFDTDYIGSLPALERIVIRRSEDIRVPEPSLQSVTALAPQRCGTLVRIDKLRYQPEPSDTETTDRSWNGYRRFVDPQGDVIYSYVREYADFASSQIPDGSVSLVGILQYDDSAGGRFLLKLRDEGDCLF